MTLNLHPKRILAVCLIFVISSANWQTVLASNVHILGEWPDISCVWLDGMPIDQPVKCHIDTVWIFCLESDHTITDPHRPPWVLGSSGPWVFSLTDRDPYGNLMPHHGIKFTLAPGGTPVGPEGGVFCHAIEPVPPEITLHITEFWHDSCIGILSSTGMGMGIWLSIPPELTEPEDRYQYVWDYYQSLSIPNLGEWGLIIFGVVLLGFITWVFLRRRKAISVRA